VARTHIHYPDLKRIRRRASQKVQGDRREVSGELHTVWEIKDQLTLTLRRRSLSKGGNVRALVLVIPGGAGRREILFLVKRTGGTEWRHGKQESVHR